MSLIKSTDSIIDNTLLESASIKITPIKAFTDNYIWAIYDKKNTTLVDPGDADVCINFLEKNKLILNSVLVTHHHSDHTGGINKLFDYCQKKQWPLTIYGPANEKIPHCDVKLIENDIVILDELSVSFRVIDLPGHTAGHIAYYNGDPSVPILFCGDTLFSAGCGRLFEGTPEQMLNSLSKLANLPDKTKVYCTHEYTKANLAFALTVEPNNQDLIKYNKEVIKLRAKDHPTIPSTIMQEKKINPFLRCNEQSIIASAQEYSIENNATPQGTFTTIRHWKDQF
jgi:hydroxyacylglutathione hydrolase